MRIEPYKSGTEVIVSNYHEDEVFEIQSYDYKYKINGDGYEDSVMYNVVHKQQRWSLKLHHDLLIPVHTIDDLLSLYSDYKKLYELFGDSEYLLKYKKIETRLRRKSIETRGSMNG